MNEGVDSAASPEENCTSLKKTCMAASIQLDGGRGGGWHMGDGGEGEGGGVTREGWEAQYVLFG